MLFEENKMRIVRILEKIYQENIGGRESFGLLFEENKTRMVRKPEKILKENPEG